jgi:hypothetical protein
MWRKWYSFANLRWDRITERISGCSTRPKKIWIASSCSPWIYIPSSTARQLLQRENFEQRRYDPSNGPLRFLSFLQIKKVLYIYQKKRKNPLLYPLTKWIKESRRQWYSHLWLICLVGSWLLVMIWSKWKVLQSVDWFVSRENYCWLVADKWNEHDISLLLGIIGSPASKSPSASATPDHGHGLMAPSRPGRPSRFPASFTGFPLHLLAPSSKWSHTARARAILHTQPSESEWKTRGHGSPTGTCQETRGNGQPRPPLHSTPLHSTPLTVQRLNLLVTWAPLNSIIQITELDWCSPVVVYYTPVILMTPCIRSIPLWQNPGNIFRFLHT